MFLKHFSGFLGGIIFFKGSPRAVELKEKALNPHFSEFGLIDNVPRIPEIILYCIFLCLAFAEILLLHFCSIGENIFQNDFQGCFLKHFEVFLSLSKWFLKFFRFKDLEEYYCLSTSQVFCDHQCFFLTFVGICFCSSVEMPFTHVHTYTGKKDRKQR